MCYIQRNHLHLVESIMLMGFGVLRVVGWLPKVSSIDFWGVFIISFGTIYVCNATLDKEKPLLKTVKKTIYVVCASIATLYGMRLLRGQSSWSVSSIMQFIIGKTIVVLSNQITSHYFKANASANSGEDGGAGPSTAAVDSSGFTGDRSGCTMGTTVSDVKSGMTDSSSVSSEEEVVHVADSVTSLLQGAAARESVKPDLKVSVMCQPGTWSEAQMFANEEQRWRVGQSARPFSQLCLTPTQQQLKAKCLDLTKQIRKVLQDWDLIFRDIREEYVKITHDVEEIQRVSSNFNPLGVEEFGKMEQCYKAFQNVFTSIRKFFIEQYQSIIGCSEQDIEKTLNDGQDQEVQGTIQKLELTLSNLRTQNKKETFEAEIKTIDQSRGKIKELISKFEEEKSKKFQEHIEELKVLLHVDSQDCVFSKLKDYCTTNIHPPFFLDELLNHNDLFKLLEKNISKISNVEKEKIIFLCKRAPSALYFVGKSFVIINCSFDEIFQNMDMLGELYCNLYVYGKSDFLQKWEGERKAARISLPKEDSYLRKLFKTCAHHLHYDACFKMCYEINCSKISICEVVKTEEDLRLFAQIFAQGKLLYKTLYTFETFCEPFVHKTINMLSQHTYQDILTHVPYLMPLFLTSKQGNRWGDVISFFEGDLYAANRSRFIETLMSVLKRMVLEIVQMRSGESTLCVSMREKSLGEFTIFIKWIYNKGQQALAQLRREESVPVEESPACASVDASSDANSNCQNGIASMYLAILKLWKEESTSVFEDIYREYQNKMRGLVDPLECVLEQGCYYPMLIRLSEYENVDINILCDFWFEVYDATLNSEWGDAMIELVNDAVAARLKRGCQQDYDQVMEWATRRGVVLRGFLGQESASVVLAESIVGSFKWFQNRLKNLTTVHLVKYDVDIDTLCNFWFEVYDATLNGNIWGGRDTMIQIANDAVAARLKRGYKQDYDQVIEEVRKRGFVLHGRFLKEEKKLEPSTFIEESISGSFEWFQNRLKNFTTVHLVPILSSLKK